jgi:hypothetical protein
MKRKITFLTTLFSPLLFISSLFSNHIIQQDTCAINDFCETAIPIDSVFADGDIVCLEGCNLNATSELLYNNVCEIGSNPTVWYSLIVVGASVLNIRVTSPDMESPTLSMYQMITDCNDMVEIPLSQTHYSCILGSNGIAEALLTNVVNNVRYLIAVSSYDTIGGSFSLCVNTHNMPSICVIDRSIEITARSAGGPLTGPFNPGETISVCMNVNSYSAANNECQWFQGLVPTFGNGWDPGSFDQQRQPMNATINGRPIGQKGNGVYSTATWDWFDDVDYHFDDPTRQLGDFDGNGTYEICNSVFDPDCPDTGGIKGGCCRPCWGAPLGDILPPGWFAYGNNGSCPTPGPPVRLDWGDGGHCGSGQGPWHFCFDLVVRGYPDCMEDTTNRDLSLSFFTFADGETGAWAGNQSVCALDPPAIANLPFICSEQTNLGIEVLADQCENTIFQYTLTEPGVEEWTWSIQPSWAVLTPSKEGANGHIINDTLYNPTSNLLEVTYYFTGYLEGSLNTVVKEVRFNIVPDVNTTLHKPSVVCERNQDTLFISAEPFTGGIEPYQFLWTLGGQTTPDITIYPPYPFLDYSLVITDGNGCISYHEHHIQLKPCHLDSIASDDESNDMHTDEDRPIGNGNFNSPGSPTVSMADVMNHHLMVLPVPATDMVRIEWQEVIKDAASLIIMDTRGQIVHQSDISITQRNDQVLQLNIKEYVSGIYMVILQTGKSITTTKMMKI